MPDPLTLRGEIRIDPAAPGFQNGIGRIYLEDVTEADAPARIVATEHIGGVSHSPGSADTIPFQLRAPTPLDPSRVYSIRVHVDANGTGSISSGDLVSTQTYPVDARQPPPHLRVSVRQVP